jgi:S1-C subfamily serine protease
MNGLDLLLVLLAVVAAAGGWRLGFVRRLASWVGAAAGLGLAIVILPDVVRWMGLESDLTILLTATALLVLFASIGQGIGAAIGHRLHRGVVATPRVRAVDSAGGSALGVVAVGVLAWLVVPVMADTAGWPAASARGSVIAEFVDERLPDPPPQITRLERQLAGGQFPQLFSGLRSAPDIPAPPAGSPVSAEMLEQAAQSAVRLTSAACGRIQTGSGFVVAPDVIVTNAHVVAASSSVQVESAVGDSATGRVVAFDPATDLALVAAPLDRPALDLASPGPGDRGLVLGFPGGGPFEPSPFEVGQQLSATGYDIYDRDLVRRQLLALASALEPGDSGSAVMRNDGSVIGVAVAVAPDRAGVAYALDIAELRQLLDGLAGRTLAEPADTGPCLR